MSLLNDVAHASANRDELIQPPMTIDLVPFHDPTKVAISSLRFDPHNPRITPDRDIDNTSDVDVVKFMCRAADLGELIQSIATSGYIDIEPLIVLADDDKFIVLEGNRRLAALKLLTDHNLAGEVGIQLPSVTQQSVESFHELSVYRVKNRDEARDFIGFKHINGPHRWDSLAKARFAANWYRAERERGVTLRDIARRMGDRHDTIQRMVAGIYVLDQAESENIFSIEDRYPGRPFAFSHLYTALTRPGYRQFLGVNEDWRRQDPSPDPIPKGNLENLHRLMLWLYGSKSDDIRPVVVSQNPHVKQLGEVLLRPKARAMMMANDDLRVAYAEVETPASQFEKSLVDAHQHVENALRKLGSFDGTDGTLIEIAEGIQTNSGIIISIMKKKKSEAN